MEISQPRTTAPPPLALAPGSVIAGRYRIERSLGRGGMAEVFHALDSSTGACVALKRLDPELVARHPVAALLFEREYHTLRQLAHPSIVQVHDYGLSELGPYYTMELLDGAELLALAPLPWREACALLRSVASALAIVHSRRLLHRDVSPRNVRRAADGRTKLIDFGAMATMDASGEVIGTPPCIPPEAVHGQPLDARADLYALGAVLYFALTGVHAYPARSVGALRDAWRSRPRAPSARVADIPAALDGLVLALLSLDPLARPVSAAEVIERLTVIAELDPDEQGEVARAYLTAPTLVGRDELMLRFRKQLLRCMRGRGGVSLVTAAPGMGRTRLLHAIELEGKLAGAAVLRAQASPELDYGVLRALCRELLLCVPELALAAAAPAAGLLAHALPELRERLAPVSLAPVGPRHEIELEAALCAWLLALCQRQCLVIVIDDAHRADASSLSALALLAQQASEQRLALVLSALEGAPGASAPLAFAALRRKATVLALEPLDEACTQQLARALFGDVPHVTRIAGWMYKLAGGNPRSCMELAAHLVERGVVRYEQGGWLLPPMLSERELPTSFEHTLEQRLTGLSADARELLLGLALSDTALGLDDYPWLLEADATGSPRMFAALDQLVAAAVLVSQGNHYAFGHSAYAELARQSAPRELEVALRRRLARLFERRGDLSRKASELLHAGDELAALQTLAAHHEETGGHLNSDAAFDALRQRALTNYSVEDTRAAVDTRRRLLEACERHGWPHRERIMIRNGLLLLANRFDPSGMRGQVEPQLACLRADSGAIFRDHFADAPPAERAKRCFEHARALYAALPVEQRVFSPDEALSALPMTLGLAQTLGRQSHDLALLAEVVALAEFMAQLHPVFKLMHTSALHSLELVRGRLDHAAALRRVLLATYEALVATGRPLPTISRIGRAIAFQLEGFERARTGRDDALEYADKLEGPLFPDDVGVLAGAHIFGRRAWEIRHVQRLYRGDAPAAQACRAQLDQLSLRHAFAPYGGGSALLEAHAFALSGDLMGLKQSIESIALIVDTQYPGLEPYLQVATGDFQRLRGEPERALRAYESVLSKLSAGNHAAWAPAACARVEALLDLGRDEAALAAAERDSTACVSAELGGSTELELGRVLALAELRVGRVAAAAQRASQLIERAIALGVQGVRLGSLYETRARIAHAAADASAFTHHANQAAEIYRAGRNPALFARLERMIDATRHGQTTLGGELAHELERSAWLGISSGPSYHTAFASCSDASERRTRALQLLLERSAAAGGLLYGVGHGGVLSLLATSDGTAPPDGLQAELAAYVQAELDETDEVTVTCFDADARATAPALILAYQPVLIWGEVAGERKLVGVAALRAEGAPVIAPDWDLVKAVGKILLESDSVVSIVA